MLKIGCCGFPVGKKRYYGKFDVVELQSTFYDPPRTETIKSWRNNSPPEFEFTVKAWQLITHPPSSPTYRKLKSPIEEGRRRFYGSFKPTEEVFGAWERVEEVASLLRARVILFQTPNSFTPTQENKRNLRTFFDSIPRAHYTFVWEPRGKWTDEEIEAICRDLDLVHGVDPFLRRPIWGKIRYLRLHGKGGYNYRYTEEDLLELKEKVQSDLPIYCMFNNVYMFEDASRFKEILSKDPLRL
jgi:uncharacterized protein YecE (DUF72 family)